jgi:hypothetical protein
MSNPKSNSNSLASLLSAATWRSLNGIAWLSKSSYHHEQTREELAASLAAHLAKPTITTGLLSALPESARDLLTSILAGDGRITSSLLSLIGGKIRALNYQHVKDAPWRAPQNDSEQLVYRGLLLASRSSDTVRYVIADDLLPTLSQELLEIEALPKVTDVVGTNSLASVQALRVNMLIFLLYCQKHGPKVLKGGRLPLPAVRQLKALFIGRGLQEDVRSHTQARYLWFVSTLALQAHLVSCPSKGRWMPTPAALTWVAAEPSEQLAQLWHSWQPGRIVRLPVPAWPADFHDWWRIRGSLLDGLRNQLASMSDDWQSLQEWSTTRPTLLELTEMGQYSISSRAQRVSALRLFSEELLPSLLALGLVELSKDGELIKLGELGKFFESLPHTQPSNQTPEAIGSTAAKIVSRMPSPKTSAWQREDERLLIDLPANFAAVWQVANFATLKAGGKRLEFELTPTTVALGLNQDFPLAALRHALAEGGLPFTKDLLPTHPSPLLRQAIWLETNQASQMKQLRQERAIQFALRGGHSLDARRHTVDPRYLKSLQRALIDLGQPALIGIPQDAGSKELRETLEAKRPRHPLPHSALLLLGARLWQRQVTQHDQKYPSVTRTPPYIPIALIQTLNDNLSPMERAAVEQIWHETLAQLDPEPNRPPAVEAEADKGLRHLEPLQQAIDRGLAVHIKYQSAGKPESERTIDPHYLQKRRHIWYLEAYCRQAQDNRNFRLDRIRQLTIVEASIGRKPKRRA